MNYWVLSRLLAISICFCMAMSPVLAARGSMCCQSKIASASPAECCGALCRLHMGDAAGAQDILTAFSREDDSQPDPYQDGASEGDCCKTCQPPFFLTSHTFPAIRLVDSSSYVEPTRSQPNSDFSTSLFRPPRS